METKRPVARLLDAGTCPDLINSSFLPSKLAFKRYSRWGTTIEDCYVAISPSTKPHISTRMYWRPTRTITVQYCTGLCGGLITQDIIYRPVYLAPLLSSAEDRSITIPPVGDTHVINGCHFNFRGGRPRCLDRVVFGKPNVFLLSRRASDNSTTVYSITNESNLFSCWNIFDRVRQRHDGEASIRNPLEDDLHLPRTTLSRFLSKSLGESHALHQNLGRLVCINSSRLTAILSREEPNTKRQIGKIFCTTICV